VRCLAALACAGLTASARVPEAAAQAIPNNRYSLDFFQGPSLAPIRVQGIGGAYAGVAEGIAGFVSNAASPALRDPSSGKWWEIDAGVSLSLPLVLVERADFDNSGTIDHAYTDFIYVAAGGLLQFGPFGAGFIAEAQRYTLTSGGVKTDVNIGRAHVLAAWSFFGGQLMVGGGARIGTMLLQTADNELTMLGAAPEFGFLVRPDWKSFRIGGTFRFPVEAGELTSARAPVVGPAGVRTAGGLVLPQHVVWPWELEVGVAVQVGPRPFNPQWQNPHDQEAQLRAVQDIERRRREAARALELASITDATERRLRAKEHEEGRAREAVEDERAFQKAAQQLMKERQARYANWPREMLLVTAELLVTGNVDRGVGLEGFLGQNSLSGPPPGARIGTSGGEVNFSPRFGIETEPIPGLVHTRFGSYYEPRRLQLTGEGATLGVGRQHFTFGADLRVLTTTFWGLVPEVTYTLQASVDIAPRYENFSIGIGNWK
jgi:hypothetical protein